MTFPGPPDPPGSPDPAAPRDPGAQPGMPSRHPRRGEEPWQTWWHGAQRLAASRRIPVPAWLRKTPGERRWPVTMSVIAAIVLQVLLPPDYTKPLPAILLPVLEGALLVGLSI